MAKAKRRAARKRWLSRERVEQLRDQAAGEVKPPRLGSYENPFLSDKPMNVSDILEIVEAAGHTLRSMRQRITQLEIENNKLQNLVDKASYH